ncbi:alternative ribosome rescue aminoacyl-tRNA hydrolase ArfB [Salinarimonas ramus]|uniref:Aminoacyl-tRNA hydrolase n=1 Tax=Salinarimonas ramus TaxID=690164 RepID=A0A917V2K3_9HYPH|nr:alternative ribosome rescue aminoacyl-tRNA hydrolase ArfB [Salinarimonas ramus]GGK23249.1 aminoacyl-tRNA hydrolase [Salinarimonas ramus]
MIEVTPSIALEEGEIELVAIRASGPGGQNVNKVSSAVQLRFDALGSPSLPDGVKARLPGVAGSRMTKDGVIVITAQVHRDQERNRADAIERLVDIIRRAAYRPPPRRPTRPTLASKRRRLDSKTKHARTKSLRGKPVSD